MLDSTARFMLSYPLGRFPTPTFPVRSLTEPGGVTSQHRPVQIRRCALSRQRNAIRSVEVKLSLSQELSARVDMLLWDPALSKPKYGSRSALISLLLTKWCDEQEGVSTSNPPLVEAPGAHA